ncbi:glycosyltransferase family 2 protein [Enterobacter hormaechei]|uniref:glycosyltransferase family 2 protein n=1 Tax=Enterobacter hormaechei TaxID=158836 RepID=UPI000795DBEF|nr:glycosyltransferase [Enterobacter hormaechei]MBD8856854.1 glycosyltransferase [Enterobacter hormaechei]MBF4181241.1 glycosyltransferase [Enterobacter hormaechei]CZW08859.1 mycofactocin system glycosyltransferase [Enterobacter hormaechei]SAE03069.1 mycofactocin system glycosyltransferase [Enterobacter hormaechei]
MQVTIDGVPFVPACASASRIGIAITTHNRPDVLNRAIEQHIKHLPAGALVVVVDDGSATPVKAQDGIKLIRHDSPKGVIAAKNCCIEYLMLAGCEHLFLFDDDAYPIADNWHKPYVESPEPVLSYIFPNWANGKPIGDAKIIGGDDRHVAYSHTRGCMIYAQRSAIETIGGFDPAFGFAMEQDVEYLDRAFHSGLTSWRFADVVGSEKLIDSLDRHQSVSSSLTPVQRSDNLSKNQEIVKLRRLQRFAEYVPYSHRPHVLTSYLTGSTDPQRGRMWEKSLKAVQPLIASTNYPVTVLTDVELTDTQAIVERVKPDYGLSVYMQRWRIQWQWLRDHPEVTELWCTDSTDVVMLNKPEVSPGILYVGWEPQLTNTEWMIKNHQHADIRDFLTTPRQLLNCGVVGGDRATMLELLHAMVVELDCQHSESPTDHFEMGAFNKVVYTRFKDRFVTGTRVTTIFKKNEASGVSWWSHK